MKTGPLAFVIANNHCMIPDQFFWSFLRLERPDNSFAVHGTSSVKASTYNTGIYRALKAGAEWMLLMDVDQIFPPHTAVRLLETAEKHNAKIVSVLYHLGRAPFGPVAGWVKEVGNETKFVNRDGNDWKETYAPLGEGVVEVDWAGTGGLLIHKDVLKDVEWPPFIDTWEPGRGIRSTGHDVNFCLRAKEKGHRVLVDTTVKSGHGKFIYVGQEFAQAFNDSGMAVAMTGVLHRQAQEKDYWDTLWKIENHNGGDRANHYPETVKNVLEEIDPGSAVADVGCGDGSLMNSIQKAKGGKITGYDFSETAIDLCKKNGFDGYVADVRSYSPNGDAASYDVVVSAHTIEHIQDEIAFVSLLKKLVKPSGKVVVATPWVEEIQGHFEHVRAYTEDGLKNLFGGVFQEVSVKKNQRDFIVVAR